MSSPTFTVVSEAGGTHALCIPPAHIRQQYAGSLYLWSAPLSTDSEVKLQGSGDQHIEKFAATTGFTRHKVWTDFGDFFIQFYIFLQIQGAGAKFNVLWLDSDHVVTILSSTRNLVEGYKTVYLCHLDSYTVTVCNGYLVSSHLVTEQLPTRCLVDRFLHRPHGSGYLITCVSNVVTVQ